MLVAELSIGDVSGIVGSIAAAIAVIGGSIIAIRQRWFKVRLEEAMQNRSAEENFLREALENREKQYREREAETEARFKRQLDFMQCQIEELIGKVNDSQEAHIKCEREHATSQGRLAAAEDHIKHLTDEVAKLRGR